MENKSIPKMLEDVAKQMCDNYCKMPAQWQEEHGLENLDDDIQFDNFVDEVCEKCPMLQLLY